MSMGLIIRFRRWLGPEKATQDRQLALDSGGCASRRSFFKRAAVGAASVAGAGGIAKKLVDTSIQPSDLKKFYRQDALTGGPELLEREYVLMSDQEKAEMVQTLIGDYPDQS